MPRFKDHLSGVITFLYLVEKTGEVHKGKLDIINGPDVNIPERQGRNPGQESVYGYATAIVDKAC
jgi:hypothetical protein